MDVPDAAPATRATCPSASPGALFFTGDAHGNQGDGELCGVALEIDARGSAATFDLIKGTAIEWPRIESPDELMAVGSARPMEDAARIAYTELIDWLAADYGFDRWTPTSCSPRRARCTSGNMVDTELLAGGRRSPRST